MSEQPEMPPWFRLLREDIAEMRRDFSERLDRLVSRDTFLQEQSRVNDKFDEMNRDLFAVRNDLTKEVQARVTAEQVLAKERLAEQQLREREAGSRRWMIFGLFAAPVVSAVLAWVISGGLTP